jgi:hypothetical protein
MTARRITLTIALLLAGLAAAAPGAHAKPWCSNAGSERLGTGESTLWYKACRGAAGSRQRAFGSLVIYEEATRASRCMIRIRNQVHTDAAVRWFYEGAPVWRDCSNALRNGAQKLYYGGLGKPVGPGSVGRTEACFRLWSGGWGPYRCAYSHVMRY